MSFTGFVFGDDLKVKWADEVELVGKSIQELFKQDRDLSSAVRWILSDESLHFKSYLTLTGRENKVYVEIARGKNHFHLLINADSSYTSRKFSNSFWTVFSQTFPGGLLFVSQDLKIVEISHMLLSVLKVKNQDNISLSKNSIVGSRLESLFKDDSNNEIFKTLIKKIEESKLTRTISKFEISYEDIDLRILCGSVYEGNSYTGSCIYIFDISEENKKSTIIKNQEIMLFQTARMAALGEMAGGIAHEINNPLAIISSSMMVLKKAMSKGKLTDQMLEDVINNTEATVVRASKIISGLRTVSRDTTGENFAPIDLREMFQDVLGLCSERFKNNGVTIDLNLGHSDFDGKIMGDRVQISQVFLNLLSNSFDAIEANPEKWIKIETGHENEFRVIRVIDSGIGIPDEIQNKMFNPFFTSKEVGKGTGLGLSISKNIIDKCGGILSVDNTVKNTCFVIKLLKA